ncbi:MAG: glycosyltransferase family 2 protein, partial [Actinomycetota bacterium]
MIRVTAILVSHDGATWLPQTVAALASQSHPIDRIVAVDTGSTDDSVRLLRSAGIHVIPTTRGVGFGEAVQLAVDATPAFVATEPKGKSASSASPSTLPAVQEWLWIVHDDCAPAKDALERLLAGVKERPQVALAGPKLRGWHDRKHLLELGVSIATNGARWTGLEYREQDQGQHDDERDVLAVSTAAMLIRREVFTELGGFDPKLSLFRDDVDLGWRVRAAGHSVIAVPEAIAYHGEAASNERRSIDVDDALLHRPLLLDRRHAAYVLLANASLIYLPILAPQLLLSALVRSIGYLIAKLPGYALDELAAVALVLIKPQEIFAARKVRRGQRLLAGSGIRSFLPPRGIQFRLAFERARNALERYLARRIPFQILPNEPESSVLDSDDEKLDEEEIFTERKSTLRTLFTRPLFLFSLTVLFLTLIASRNRFGAIEGGALLQSPSSGMDLISKYFESWHPIALGSSANTPTWVALVGLASGLLLGNLKLLIALFFYAAIPLTLWIGYRFAKGFTTSTLIALAAASAYAFSPPILHAATHGLIGTLVIALITPLLIKSMMGASAIESLSWRAVAAHALLYSIALAFSPPAFIILATWHFLLSMMQTLGEFGRRLRGDREDLQLVIARIVKRS